MVYVHLHNDERKAMKNPTDASTLVGRAVYLELHNEHMTSTFQILITPPVRLPSSPSNMIAPVMYRRQLTHSSPKRQWKTTHASGYDYIDASVAEARLGFLDNLLERLANAKFTVFKEPIIVDVSVEDMAAIQLHRTPYKIIGRIERVRRAKGYPKEYLPKPA